MSAPEPVAGWREFARAWPVLGGAALGMAIGVTGVVPYTSGVFLPHLAHEFGWTKSGISVGQLLQAYGGAAMAPLAGALVDRTGVRVSATIGLLGFAACLASLAFLAGRIEVLWLTMTLIGFFGAACGPMVFTRAVNASFDRNRGLALGLVVGGVGVGAAVYPVAVNAVIAASGWRAGYVALAVTVGVLAPLAIYLIGHTPRGERSAAGPRTVIDWKPILVASLFWRLLAACVLAAVAVTGYLLHLVPMLRELGVSPGRAAALQSLIGVSVLVSRLSAGAVADRLFAPWTAALCMGAGAGAALALAGLGPAAAVPAVVGLGLALGCEVDLLSYMVARYYPLGVYGRVHGVIYGGALLGAGSSPVWIGWVADRLGGYPPALMTSAAIFAGAAALFATLPRFPKA